MGSELLSGLCSFIWTGSIRENYFLIIRANRNSNLKNWAIFYKWIVVRHFGFPKRSGHLGLGMQWASPNEDATDVSWRRTLLIRLARWKQIVRRLSLPCIVSVFETWHLWRWLPRLHIAKTQDRWTWARWSPTMVHCRNRWNTCIAHK